jgi:hypothetical protein
VTFFALGATLPLVLIIFFVTGMAILGRMVAEGFALMTASAGRLPMLADQGEMGVALMVELGLVPFFRHMATLTLLAQVTAMVIIQFVAGVTFLGRALEGGQCVTHAAVHLLVGADQGESGGFVGKTILFPASFIMTMSAILTQLALMGFGLAMAGHAFVRGLTELAFARMAFFTILGLVFALEGEIRLSMIEIAAVQSGDFEIASMVLVVARLAETHFTIGNAPMKSRGLFHVASLLFVAAQTGGILHGLVHGVVALFAGFLHLGVSRHQIAWHDQGLEGVGIGGSQGCG